MAQLPAQPTVAFILATHNRGPVVTDCLRHTLNCGLPASQFIITVVDNASTDDTPALLRALAAEHGNIQVIRLPSNRGPVAKNFALQNNPADILVLLDDDAYPLPGSVRQMIRHFHDDPHLAAAVFDVALPDGTQEASAYPDVFIGAGTALRAAALKALPASGPGSGGRGGPLLPRDFFMQAEEYDLSFRLLAAGHSVQRFWDMPLLHLKTPNARIGHRTTRLDVRNNLYLLAKYLPEPLCHQFAADWLDRYWRMALQRDQNAAPGQPPRLHKKAFMQGAAEGLARWHQQRRGGLCLLPPTVIEKIFKFSAIEQRLHRAMQHFNLRRIAFADLGKNMLPFHRAAARLGLKVAAIVDHNLADPVNAASNDYRGIRLMNEPTFRTATLAAPVDALVLTAVSPVHARRRASALRRVFSVPVLDLFSKGHIMSPNSGSSAPISSSAVPDTPFL